MTPRKLRSMSLSQLRARGGSGPWLFISTTQREHARVNNRAQMRCHGLAPDAKRVVRAGGEQQLAVAVEDDRLRPAPRTPHPPPRASRHDPNPQRAARSLAVPCMGFETAKASRKTFQSMGSQTAEGPSERSFGVPKDLPKGPSALDLSKGPSALRRTFQKVLQPCGGPSKKVLRRCAGQVLQPCAGPFKKGSHARTSRKGAHRARALARGSAHLRRLLMPLQPVQELPVGRAEDLRTRIHGGTNKRNLSKSGSMSAVLSVCLYLPSLPPSQSH